MEIEEMPMAVPFDRGMNWTNCPNLSVPAFERWQERMKFESPTLLARTRLKKHGPILNAENFAPKMREQKGETAVLTIDGVVITAIILDDGDHLFRGHVVFESTGLPWFCKQPYFMFEFGCRNPSYPILTKAHMKKGVDKVFLACSNAQRIAEFLFELLLDLCPTLRNLAIDKCSSCL